METSRQHNRMLNAGFCGTIVAMLVQGAGQGRGVSLIATYLLVPMLLHPYTAQRIVRAREDSLSELVRRHPRIILGFERRITIATPNVRAGIILALRRGALTFDRETGAFYAGASLDNFRFREILSPDDHAHIDAALRMGRWTTQMSVAQICDALLVRPVLASSSIFLARDTDAVGRNA